MTTPHDAEKMLGRIRALLTKAENPAATPAEAEAFTAKAAELMAKYGIDRAMLAAADPTSDIPGDRIVIIEGRYAIDKQRLLSAVGEAVGCRTVLRTRWNDGRKRREVHLFGYGSDLERVELLYTSLLVQATNGMNHTPVPWDENPAAFRRSWLVGFTRAITERLHAAQKRAQADAERSGTNDGPSVALILADRASVVQARMAAAYPKLGTLKARKLTGSGYWHGHHHGHRADLGGARLDSAQSKALNGGHPEHA